MAFAKKEKAAPVGGFMSALVKDAKVQKKFLDEKYQGDTNLFIDDAAIDWVQGSFKRGKSNLFFGPTKSGKSTFALILAAKEQKRTGGYVIIFDSEYSHDVNDPATTERWTALGLDPEKTMAISSNRVDVLFAHLGKLQADLASSRKQDIEGVEPKKRTDSYINIAAIVVDSWDGVQAEQATAKINAGDVSAAGHAVRGNAKTINPILKVLLYVGATYGITLFFVQHCNENMDKTPTGAYKGPKWILLGGQKLRYLCNGITFVESAGTADAIVDVDGVPVNESGGIPAGKRIKIRCEKSRKQVEGRTAETWMNFSTGTFINRGLTLFNLSSKIGVLEHPQVPVLNAKKKPELNEDGTPKTKENKAWWQVRGTEEKFNGQAQMIAAFNANPGLYTKTLQECMKSDKVSAVEEEENLTSEELFGNMEEALKED